MSDLLSHERLHWQRNCYKPLEHCLLAYEVASSKQQQGKGLSFPLYSSYYCNHKFSPESAREASVHFCIVNRIAHSLTKQVILLRTLADFSQPQFVQKNRKGLGKMYSCLQGRENSSGSLKRVHLINFPCDALFSLLWSFSLIRMNVCLLQLKWFLSFCFSDGEMKARDFKFCRLALAEKWNSLSKENIPLIRVNTYRNSFPARKY